MGRKAGRVEQREKGKGKFYQDGPRETEREVLHATVEQCQLVLHTCLALHLHINIYIYVRECECECECEYKCLCVYQIVWGRGGRREKKE